MSADLHAGLRALPAHLLKQVDVVCDRFAAAWQPIGAARDRPRIEDYLVPAAAAEGPALVQQLVLVDIDQRRRRRGESPRPEDYQLRFPDLDTPWLLQALAPPADPTATAPVAPGPAKAPVAPASAEGQRLRCPHCHNPIQLQDDRPDEVLCPACGSSFQVRDARQTTTAAGMRPLGKFQLLERVGVGAFGAVWKARDTELDRIVALKIPHAGLFTEKDELERFHREARAAAQLRHPGIVTVHEVQVLEGLPVIVADFVEGAPLKDLLQTRQLTFRESATLIADVAEALHYAHGKGLVHRDIKPANIMLDYSQRPRTPDRSAAAAAPGLGQGIGRPLVMDFGLALRSEAEVTLTLEGQIIGTPAYLSPEQAAGQGHRVDGRSDVYSLGVILYELLGGELPFRGSRAMLLVQVLHEEPRPLRQLNDKIPRDLETICHKALAKEPSRRYATAQELTDDLRRWLNGEPIQARPVSAWERAWIGARRRPAVAALLVVGLVAALALVGAIVGAVYNGRLQVATASLQVALDDAKQQRQKAEQFQYFHHIARAHAGWRDGNLGEVGRLLDDCPVAQRRWEWHYLKRLGHAELLTLEGHRDMVGRVEFSPDGRRLASASRDKTVKVWDVTTGQLQCTLQGHTEEVWSVAFSPDGKQLASASAGGTVRIWDVMAERELHTLPIKISLLSNLAYSPDGTRLASISGQRPGMIGGWVKLWDATTGQEILAIPESSGASRTVAFSPDGKKLAWGSRDRIAKVWDFEAGQVLFTFTGHKDAVAGVAFSADGKRLATASFDRTVKVWDMTLDRRGEVISPLLTLIGHTNAVFKVAFSPDGTQIGSAGPDRSVRVWDAVTGQETLTLIGHTDAVNHVAFSPDGTRLASAGNDKTVKVWDATNSHDVSTFKSQTETRGLWGVTFSPDGTRLASAGTDDTVKVWDAVTRQEIHTLTGPAGAHGDRAYGSSTRGDVAFSPDGNRLASASAAGADKTVKIWDVATGQLIQSLTGHTSAVTGVAFSSDGVRLASTSADGTVRIWDAAKGQELRTLKGHKARVWRVAFSPDKTRLASASDDSTVRIWDAATGQPIRTLPHKSIDQVQGVVFSPDGRTLASASWQDQAVRIWDVQNE